MVDKLIVFFTWVGVIKTKICFTTIFFTNCKVKSDRFSVSNMEIAVRLWWKTCHNSALCERSMSSKLFSSVTSINISTNKSCNVKLRFFFFLLFLNNWFYFFLWFWFFALSLNRRLTNKFKFFLFNRSSNNATISPFV